MCVYNVNILRCNVQIAWRCFWSVKHNFGGSISSRFIRQNVL